MEVSDQLHSPADLSPEKDPGTYWIEGQMGLLLLYYYYYYYYYLPIYQIYVSICIYNCRQEHF
jgi:hypothetical protein